MSHPGLHNETSLFTILRQWLTEQWLRPLDVAWGTFLAEEAQRLATQVPASGPAHCPAPLLLAAVLTSHQVGRGHVCLDLEAVLRDPNGVLALPPEGSKPDGAVAPRETVDALRCEPINEECRDVTPLTPNLCTWLAERTLYARSAAKTDQDDDRRDAATAIQAINGVYMTFNGEPKQ